MNKFSENDRITLSRAIASWFVRRDGKYYDIDNPTVPLSLPDVQAACIERFREEQSDIGLSADLLKATFKITFSSLTASPDERVGAWNDRLPSNSECQEKGIAYYREIGSFPRFSTGENAIEEVRERCERSPLAFGR